MKESSKEMLAVFFREGSKSFLVAEKVLAGEKNNKNIAREVGVKIQTVWNVRSKMRKENILPKERISKKKRLAPHARKGEPAKTETSIQTDKSGLRISRNKRQDFYQSSQSSPSHTLSDPPSTSLTDKHIKENIRIERKELLGAFRLLEKDTFFWEVMKEYNFSFDQIMYVVEQFKKIKEVEKECRDINARLWRESRC